jgi:hypothetical protein
MTEGGRQLIPGLSERADKSMEVNRIGLGERGDDRLFSGVGEAEPELEWLLGGTRGMATWEYKVHTGVAIAKSGKCARSVGDVSRRSSCDVLVH